MKSTWHFPWLMVAASRAGGVTEDSSSTLRVPPRRGLSFHIKVLKELVSPENRKCEYWQS